MTPDMDSDISTEAQVTPVPAAENPAPLSAEEFADGLAQLVKRAEASGLDPIRVITKTYGRQVVASIGQQGMATVNGFLDRLVDGNLLKKS